ncbi:phosphoglycolate phosphatase [uncultured Roseibium sp.]|uniref:phosphoglycolate phosphatase n=1 Tax=uncultured Roseibium sp. TaxID=1936171 RepID=UPI00321651AF
MNKVFGTSGDRCGWPQAMLFDLDGTLIDSVADIAKSVNILLAKENLATLSVDEVRAMIGNGIAKLVERAFAARGIDLEGDGLIDMTARMMDIYKDHLTEETFLLEGAEDILRAYSAAGIKMAVVTNKPEAFSRRILEHFALGDVVDCVVGGDTGPARKPAPDMLQYAAAEMGWHVSRALMVGDSPADIGAAAAAGMASVAVRGGYTNVPVDELGADVVIDSLRQLPSAIEKLKEPA